MKMGKKGDKQRQRDRKVFRQTGETVERQDNVQERYSICKQYSSA